ncbi:hypothetical protein NDU88_003356 [Pleurodeles waltl]|uniref:Uncharacterized protein n=1 Tax=Pleurodeles waltl TaxID=8319 RepID=A0AAV7KUM7_PLEWA|nr:hypothetical protein NDU88_003356 [Pleurodeles waltl]
MDCFGACRLRKSASSGGRWPVVSDGPGGPPLDGGLPSELGAARGAADRNLWRCCAGVACWGSYAQPGLTQALAASSDDWRPAPL